MKTPTQKTGSPYNNRLRVRVGALILSSDSRELLLVQHRGIWGPESFWTPPGGGVNFGESLSDALIRETAEETGLRILPGELRYILDFIRPPLHAVSHYFSATVLDGTLQTGKDPELDQNDQLILQTRFVPISELPEMNLYPASFRSILRNDIASHFSKTPRYLGTLR